MLRNPHRAARRVACGFPPLPQRRVAEAGSDGRNRREGGGAGAGNGQLMSVDDVVVVVTPLDGTWPSQRCSGRQPRVWLCRQGLPRCRSLPRNGPHEGHARQPLKAVAEQANVRGPRPDPEVTIAIWEKFETFNLVPASAQQRQDPLGVKGTSAPARCGNTPRAGAAAPWRRMDLWS